MKKFTRVMCAIFVAMFTLLATGCASGGAKDHQNLIDRYKKGEMTLEQFQEELKKSQTVPMYGTKVLYRPDHYDYDTSVGEGNQEYYGQYAWRILSDLGRIYGIASFSDFDTEPPIRPLLNDKTQEYYYDSIRYHITNTTKFDKKIIYTQDDNGNEEIDGIKYNKEEFNDVITITADTSYSWNWNFGVTAAPQGYIYNLRNSIYSKAHETNSTITNTYFAFNYDTELSNYYQGTQTYYLATYLTDDPDKPNTQQSIDNYSDYVKALEYVIYCITMDLTPANITSSLDANGLPVVNVQGFANVDEALTFIKGVFDRIGTYVGINSYKAARISSYISVLSSTAAEGREYYDKDGNLVGVDTTGLVNEQTVQIGRNYALVVSEIVNNVCSYVHIGSDNENDIITNRFPASEVVDYYGNNFFISGTTGEEFDNIKAREYQSVLLMLSEKMTFDNIMLHFKYDAGMDGDEIYQKNASITINVKINLFKHGEGWRQLKTESITVKDGPFNAGEENHTLCLFGIDPDKKGFKVGAFNPEVGGGVLKCMDYDGKTAISDPIRLVGTTELKNWYKLVEPEPTEEPQKVYYSYGIINHEKFEGSDGCDYIEIAYEVIKTTGDYNTNYKFHTGLGVVC